jgi:hypothetical protein
VSARDAHLQILGYVTQVIMMEGVFKILSEENPIYNFLVIVVKNK